MDVVVVYESQLGNTRLIAEDIAAGIREAVPDEHVSVLPVTEATPEAVGDAALVVGGPTHVLGMSKASTRRKALETREEKAPGDERVAAEAQAETTGVREWLDTLPRQRTGRVAAAFDTRLPSRLAGGAAARIARGLRKHGYEVTEHKGFIVEDADGPLRTGERERARAWGVDLAQQLARRSG